MAQASGICHQLGSPEADAKIELCVQMFARDQNCEKKEEEAGQVRGRRFPHSFHPAWWGILR